MINNRFSEEFKAFFLPKYHMYLDVSYLYYRFTDSTESKFYGCMFHESRTSSQQVLQLF